jgi:hypothetical protein
MLMLKLATGNIHSANGHYCSGVCAVTSPNSADMSSTAALASRVSGLQGIGAYSN